MFAHTTPTPENDPGQQAADEHTPYYTRLLHDLLDIGLELARTLPAQAKAQAEACAATPTPAPGATDDEPRRNAPDVALAYDRIARTVRRTILLAKKLAEPAPPPAAQGAMEAGATQRAAARRRIIREVEDAIGRAATGDGAERLNAELIDRLDAPDLDDDITLRPTADIIADICRDLGLEATYGARPWKRRTPSDIERLCARAARLPPGRTPPGAAAQPHARSPRTDEARHSAKPRAVPLAATPSRTAPAEDAAPTPAELARLLTGPAAARAAHATTGRAPPPRRPFGPPAAILPYARPPDP